MALTGRVLIAYPAPRDRHAHLQGGFAVGKRFEGSSSWGCSRDVLWGTTPATLLHVPYEVL